MSRPRRWLRRVLDWLSDDADRVPREYSWACAACPYVVVTTDDTATRRAVAAHRGTTGH